MNITKRIGFIGVGIMGKGMVRNLRKHGLEVRIYARHREKVADIVAEGTAFFPTIAQCVTYCDVVITMVGFPQDVEEVYFQAGNIFDSVDTGACGTAKALGQRQLKL